MNSHGSLPNNDNKSGNLVQRTRYIFERHSSHNKSPSPVKAKSYRRTVSCVSSEQEAIIQFNYKKKETQSLETSEGQTDEDYDFSESTSRVQHMIKQFERQCSLDEKINSLSHNDDQKTFENLDKKKERKKIRSFIEAEDEEDTEQYRRSLIGFMDSELAKMKLDGFIDNEENEINNPYENIYFDKSYENIYSNSEIASHFSEKQKNSDDFTESLGDDLENGSYVVEAYNDDGRELIVVEVVVDRKPVPLKQLEKAINEERKCSDFVLYRNIDSTFQDVSAEELKLDNKGSNNLDAYYVNNSRPSVTRKSENDKNAVDRKNYLHLRESTLYINTSTDTEYYEEISPNITTEYTEDAKWDSNFVQFGNSVDVNYDNIESPSNRSTMYSSASRDSDDDDDYDDEGISFDNVEIRNRKYDNAKRETYCDSKGQIRIERIAKLESGMNIQDDKGPISPSVSSMTPSTKLNYIIKEIKTTEKKYLEDLAKVVKVYRPFILRRSINSLVDSQKHLFGNIVDIYKKQKEFYLAIKDLDDIYGVVRAFIDHESLFQKYPTYFRNKPKADKVLKEFSSTIKQMQEEFDERLDFSAYLLTPVQRLGKYILFLENILSTLGKLGQPVGSTQMALDIVKKEMSKGNDFVAIESIQNSPISKIDYGTFKMREKFIAIRPKRMEVVVFLFTNIIIITTSDPREMETFNYFDSIKMIDLRIATYDDLTLHLTNFTKSKKKRNASRYTYVLEARTDKLKALWREAIESLLWQQLYIAKEKSLKRSKSREAASKSTKPRIKSTGSSTFYVDAN